MAGGDIRKKPAIPEKLSRDAKEFLHLCMKRNPEDRPDTSVLIQHPFVADVSSTIHNFIPLSPPPTPPPTSPGQARAMDQSQSEVRIVGLLSDFIRWQVLVKRLELQLLLKRRLDTEMTLMKLKNLAGKLRTLG
jgi:serine/threonine protein kinase